MHVTKRFLSIIDYHSTKKYIGTQVPQNGLLCLLNTKDILKTVAKQFDLLWQSMVAKKGYVSRLLTNIFFGVHQNKKIHTDLEQRIEHDKIVIFGRNCPFN